MQPVNHYLEGIDVSHAQNDIDWQQVKNSAKKFAFVKATEGASYQDVKFQDNWSGIKNQQLMAGAYHLFRGTSSAADQLHNICSTLQQVKFNFQHDLLAIDVEKDDGLSPVDVSNHLAQLLEPLCSLAGFTRQRLLIYSAPDWWNHHVDSTGYDFSQYPLWVAYWSDAEQPKLPQPWTDWSIWQYSDKGSVMGITGAVDMDRMKRSFV